MKQSFLACAKYSRKESAEHNFVFKWLIGKLLAKDYSEEESGDEDDNGKDGAGNPKNRDEATKVSQRSPQKPKRLYPRYVRCENCGQEFDITQTKSPECVFHTGLPYPLHLVLLHQFSNPSSLANWLAR